MNHHLPIPGQKLPILAIGNIRLRDGWQLVVKSPRSAILYLALWWPSRIYGWWSGDIDLLNETLKRWGVLHPTASVKGFFAYRTRDARKRVYMIIRTDVDDLFAKVGRDISEEMLPSRVKKNLDLAGFLPQLPILRCNEAGTWMNLYHYISASRQIKTRLSDAESREFVAALNPEGAISERSLDSFLFNAGTSARIRAALGRTVVQALIERIGAYSVAIGRVHGDLMSANIMRPRKGKRPIAILDWESFHQESPLLLDFIGSREWAEVERCANKALSVVLKGTIPSKSEMLDALAFMLIAAAKDFSPAIDWLERLHES